jgi:hypothetical protein
VGLGTPVPKPNRASVDAIVKSGQRVPSGRWTATLRVGGGSSAESSYEWGRCFSPSRLLRRPQVGR